MRNDPFPPPPMGAGIPMPGLFNPTMEQTIARQLTVAHQDMSAALLDALHGKKALCIIQAMETRLQALERAMVRLNASEQDFLDQEGLRVEKADLPPADLANMMDNHA